MRPLASASALTLSRHYNLKRGLVVGSRELFRVFRGFLFFWT